MVCVSVITLCVCVQIALLLCGFAVKVQIPAAVRRGSKLRGRISLDEMRNVLSAVGPTNCLVRLSPLALALCDRYIECCAFKSCQLYIFFFYTSNCLGCVEIGSSLAQVGLAFSGSYISL